MVYPAFAKIACSVIYQFSVTRKVMLGALSLTLVKREEKFRDEFSFVLARLAVGEQQA